VRILFWSEGFHPQIGGAEVLAVRLIRALRERGYEFLAITRKDCDELPDESEHEGVSVYRFPFWAALAERSSDRVMRVRRDVAALKRAFRPDLVHVHQPGPSVVFLRQTAKVTPVPVLVTLHRTSPGRFVQPETVLGSTLRSATWVTACSAAVLSQARQQVPEIMPYSSVVRNSLDLPAVHREPLPFDPPRLLCLGRLVREKGFDVALTAFAALRERFPTARLVIAGDGIDRASLQEQAVSLGIASAVDFLGWVAPADVPALINSSTVVVMPSRREGLPLVALQAAQLARPIVATGVGGLPEVIVHRQTGLLVEREDSQALAEAIGFLLDHPETARWMGEAGGRRGQDLFSWERHVQAYDALYQQLIRDGPRVGSG
jgi:glycogen synthase